MLKLGIFYPFLLCLALMKKISLVSKITCVLFMLIVVGAVVFTMPLYKRLVRNVSSFTEEMFGKVTEVTGLTVSYDTFSPSVLSSINIKGVEVVDEQNQDIASIKNIRINYKILEIIKGDFTSFIRAVNINGVEVNLFALIETIQNIGGQEFNGEVDLEQILSYVPGNVTVKNVSLNYEDQVFAGIFNLKEIGIFNSQKKDSLDFMLETNANGLIKQNSMALSGKVFINGSLSTKLENSLVYISFSDLSNGTFAINKLNLLAGYKNDVVDIHTIQSVNPLAVDLKFDIKKKELSASIQSENLNPMTVVSFAGKSEATKILKNVRVTMDTRGSAVLKDNGSLEDIKFSTSGKTSLPSAVIPGGAVVSFDIAGNDRSVEVTRIAVDGKNCNLDGNLSFVFDTLQLGGNLNLNKYLLPNGNEISTELYFDPLDKGFMMFSPQIFIGDKALTALQTKVLPREDSFDFEMEVSDYSHFTSNEPGIISLNGSYLLDSNFIQTSISFNRIYVQSMLQFLEQCLDEKTKEQLVKADNFTAPYMFTGDVFVSTNFSSVSYNVPYLVMANTEKENQLLFVAVNGNDQNVQLDRFDLIFGKFAMNASAGLDFIPGSKDMTFYLDATSSSVPYHFQGAISSDAVKVAGDYGTDIEINFSKKKEISGTAFFENLPFSYEKIGIIVSADTSFKYTEETGPEVQVVKFALEETDATTSSSPKLVLSGNGTKYGAQLNSISYTDTYSTLEGFADIALNMNESIFESVGVNLSLKNPSGSGEELVLDAMVSNPDSVPLNIDALMNSLYISTLAEINHFSLNRFMAVKNSNNEVSATLSLSGNIAHPYALVDVKKISFLLANEMVGANGTVILEDSDLTIENFAVNQSQWKVKDIKGNISLKEMTGSVAARFETSGAKNIVLPMNLTVHDSYIPEGAFIPDNMLINLSSPGLGGSLFKKELPFDITAMYSPDFISFYSNEELGFTGTFTKTEGLYSQLNTSDILSATITGIFKDNDLNLSILNARADLSKLIKYIELNDALDITQGVLQGDVVMAGTYDTPEFFGQLEMENPKVHLPSVFAEDLSTDKITISASNNEIIVQKNAYSIGKNKIFDFDGKVVLNKWVLDSMAFNVKTLEKKSLPLKIKTPIVSVSGDVDCDLQLYLQDNVLDVNGSVSGEKVNIVSNLKDITNLSANENAIDVGNDFYVRTKLQLFLGTHVMLNFNPLLRCIFAPNTRIGLNIDTLNQNYEIDGKLSIKSGDIAYVNRNFYIKEGTIKFNPLQINNPQITVRAETREKDDKGQNVRIVLSAENQYLLDFNPRFSSIPGKSENEIYSLLGQVVIADLDQSEGAGNTAVNLLSAASGFAFQSVATRQLENKLRESLNFDIFSLRANFIQNMPTLINNNTPESISVGNFLDVSTVYIGKYLGSAMYADAMLNLSVANSDSSMAEDGKYLNRREWLLQPEIGFEFALPFSNNKLKFAESMDANFRFGMEGNLMMKDKLESFDFSIIPSVSMSLLWRF